MYVAGGRGGPGGRGGGRGGFGRGFGDEDGRIQTCYKCGGPNHFARDCHAKSVKCYACGKFEGHIVTTYLPDLISSLANVRMWCNPRQTHRLGWPSMARPFLNHQSSNSLGLLYLILFVVFSSLHHLKTVLYSCVT